MPYRVDARVLEKEPEWLVDGDRRTKAIAFLVAAAALGVVGAAEMNERAGDHWYLEGDATRVAVPGFDPGLTEPPPTCRYFIPFRIGEHSYCGTVVPAVIEQDPLLECPDAEELRRMWSLPRDQPIQRLYDSSMESTN